MCIINTIGHSKIMETTVNYLVVEYWIILLITLMAFQHLDNFCAGSSDFTSKFIGREGGTNVYITVFSLGEQERTNSLVILDPCTQYILNFIPQIGIYNKAIMIACQSWINNRSHGLLDYIFNKYWLLFPLTILLTDNRWTAFTAADCYL